ncbi:MAG: nucleotide sugar dehydrogenase [Bacteroidota bacterium]
MCAGINDQDALVLMTKSIVIWGMGWLGIPLAKKLREEDHQVIGITRNEDKKEQLFINGIQAIILIDLEGEIEKIKSCQIFILLVPPRRDSLFLENLDFILHNLPKSACFIYTSSIGIYQNINGVVDENSLLDETSDVFFSENFIQARRENSIFLRLGGLIGPNRHPVHFLAKKMLNKSANQVVNLVQQTDVIEVITRIIQNPIPGIYNLCSNEHPTRHQYYNEAAQAFGFKELEFENSNFESGKIIDSKKVIQACGLNKFTSLYDFELCK